MRQAYVISTLSVCLAAPLTLIARVQREIPTRAEERIQREVRHEILMLPYLNVFDNITYRVEGCNVTLMGQVVDPVLMKDVENAVKP